MVLFLTHLEAAERRSPLLEQFRVAVVCGEDGKRKCLGRHRDYLYLFAGGKPER